METVIETHDLTKKFGDFIAVDAVSFTVEKGEVVGYLGPNGSGKTTTIRMLLGLLTPTGGRGRVLGFDIAREPGKVRERVGYMSQKFALYDELTALENLDFYAGVYGVQGHEKRTRIVAVLEQVGLTDMKHEPVRGFSTGWRQRLALGTAMIHQPQLLFLDEPTSGVDPSARRAFWDLIYELSAQGVTVFVTTHYMDEAEYCGRVGIMRNGKLLALDTPSALKMNALPGKAWEVFAEPLLPALAVLEGMPGVIRAGLMSDHLNAISEKEVTEEQMVGALRAQGFANARAVQTEATLEDVFLALAARGT
ncbi:MAG: ABC transporter ATP-binding protein [Anaerolineales bacterium]